ncbi:hypothetical protein JCM16303_006269 [Sporobolomyces ruberrimus]
MNRELDSPSDPPNRSSPSLTRPPPSLTSSSSSSTTFLDLDSSSRLAPPALAPFLDSLAVPSRYSLRHASTISRLYLALNAFALDPSRPFHSLFDLPPSLDPFSPSTNSDSHPISLSTLQLPLVPSSSSSHSSSKPCGHVFKPGESVYRCRTCGLDSTCVLCSRCFHASPEHRRDRHDVTVSVHSGVGAGCCDCGDEEAWKEGKQRECKLHKPTPFEERSKEDEIGEEERWREELGETCKEEVREVLRRVLDWSLGQFEKSPRDVVTPRTIQDFANVARSNLNRPTETIEQEEEEEEEEEEEDEEEQSTPTPWNDSVPVGAPRLRSASIPNPLSNPWSTTTTSSNSTSSSNPASRLSSGPFAVVLWNDEKHSFPQVIEIVSRSTGCSRSAASLVAQRVDVVGRDVILITPTAEEALRVSKTINSIDLGIDVRDAKECFEECLAGEVFKWVKGLMKVRVGREENALSRVVGEVWTEIGQGEREGESRFMRLARVEERLWKEVRKNVQEIAVGLMSVGSEIKTKLSIQYATIYPHLCNSYLLTDREPENSLIFLSVQIFTVPSICSTLVQPPYNFLSTILDILFAFFTEQTDPPRPPPLPSPLDESASSRPKPRRLILPPNPTVRWIDPESSPSFKQKRYFQLFSDLNHLISSPTVQQVIVASNEAGSLLEKLVGFLSLFEGMNPVQRAVGSHVEYESDSWVSAFNVTIQLSKVAKSFGSSYRLRASGIELARGLTGLIKRMNEGVQATIGRNKVRDVSLGGEGRKYESFEFDVAKEKLSFHHPLTWLWSEMAKNVGALDKGELEKLGVMGGVSELAGGKVGGNFFLALMEQPLRVIVLVAQVRAGLWVRNGFGVRAQQLHYKEYSLRENTYDQDLFFLQNSLVILDPSQVFASIMDRFDLTSWLIEGKDEHKVFEPIQAMAMTEELLSLLIALVSDPTCTKPLTDSEALRRELVHYLALGPCVYSDLLRRISERFGDDPSMDRILSEISHFKPPTGTNDQGTYSLRDECYDDVDPYFSRYTRNQREEVDKIVRDQLRKRSSTSTASTPVEPVIVPTPVRIEKGPFVDLVSCLSSPVLLQLVFFSLKHGRARGELFSEVVVDQALHLLMLALVNPANKSALIEFARSAAPVEESHSNGTNVEEEEREADEYVPKSSTLEEDESTLVRLLVKIEEDERMKTVKHKAGWILDQFEARLGDEVGQWRKRSMVSQEEEVKRKSDEKRLAAKKRQEAIMQQFAKAQSAFLESVEDEEDDDEDYEDDEVENDDEVKMEAGPSKPRIDFGSCIVCQDELEESKAFGVLGLVQGSNLIRLTPTADDDTGAFQKEIMATPASLDEDASTLRPFGIAAEKQPVHSYDESGDGIARGFPQNQRSGFHASSCGHLMHLACFETYCGSIATRHRQQPTRCHPETIERREFVCPLCKSLGNVLLPANHDSPAFHPYDQAFDSRTLKEWADASTNPLPPTSAEDVHLDEQTLARVARLQVLNDLDHSVVFKPWRISLALPAVLLDQFSDREGLMIARLLQVVTALKSEIGGPSGGVTTLTQDLVGYTISSMEIALRGTADPAWKIGDANLRLLQSLFSTMQHVIEAMSPSLEDARRVAAVSIRQRLGGFFARGTKFQFVEFTRYDTLGTVIESATCAPSIFYHVVNVSFYTFLAQSLIGVYRYLHQCSGFVEWKGDENSEEARTYLGLAELHTYFDDSPAIFRPDNVGVALTIGKHLYAQLLPWLRRAAIVARVAFGEPSNMTGSRGTEYDRLLALLQILPPSTILGNDEDLSKYEGNDGLFLSNHLVNCSATAPSIDGYDQASAVERLVKSSAPEIEHPAIYELLGLPHHLDTLITSALERQCTRCETTPENPAVCLFCGELVCCQSFCCMAGEEEAQHGECNEHMWTCGGSIGIYFLVKRNVILYLHTDKGAFTHPPYLDSHGEVDNGRTRSRSVFPQYLHQGRYDEVRKVWLNQGVPTLVARKLEASTDHGGWTTM